MIIHLEFLIKLVVPLIVLLQPALIFSQGADREIKRGDFIDIIVFENEGLSKVVVVREDGTLDYPFLQEVPVTGMTLGRLQRVITHQLANFITNPFVDVSFAKEHIIKVNVVGLVRNPGYHMVSNKITVQGLIAIAGGTDGDADISKIRIAKSVNGGVSEISVNLQRFLEDGNLRNLPALEDGDIVIVPGMEKKDKVRVFGEVNTPGYYIAPYNADILDMILLAGGPTGNAGLNNVRLVRKFSNNVTEGEVNISKLIKEGRDIPQSIPGDVIVVSKKGPSFGKIFLQTLGITTSVASLVYIIVRSR